MALTQGFMPCCFVNMVVSPLSLVLQMDNTMSFNERERAERLVQGGCGNVTESQPLVLERLVQLELDKANLQADLTNANERLALARREKIIAQANNEQVTKQLNELKEIIKRVRQ